ATFVDSLRVQFICRLKMVAVLCGSGIERHHGLASAAFLRSRTIPFVGQKMIESGQQERAEFPLLPIYRVEVVLLQHPLEKRLGQILGVLGAVSASSDKGVKRIPISPAKFFERSGTAV